MKPLQQMGAAEAISVVIPTLNESCNIAALLAHVKAGGWAEIIVSDGGSTDGTVAAVSSEPEVRLICGSCGRGRQINRGIAAAASPNVVVLHADTLLPDGAQEAICQTLTDPTVVGGCFRLRFDKRSPLLNMYGILSRFETRLSTFGDQAYFFRKADFDAAGGAPDWPLLEDVELRRRLRCHGRFVKVALTVTTSSRRFDAHGRLLVQGVNALLLLGYSLGVPIRYLENFQDTFARAP